MVENQLDVDIPKKANVRVIWTDLPENYSSDNRDRVRSYFANKYNINQSSINVIFKPRDKSIDVGHTIADGVIDNIMVPEYQKGLIKQWIDSNGISVDIDRVFKLDDKINNEINTNPDADYRYRKWFLKKIEFGNTLSFGDNNTLDYSNFNGITVVTGEEPYENQTGKTTLLVDIPLLLFFNTTTKTSKVIDLFNKYSNNDQLFVRGILEIDGEEYVIERIIDKQIKKDGEFATTCVVNFYRLLPSGDLDNLTGEQRRETDKLISSIIGSIDDFTLTILVTSDNLEDLISTTPAKRSKIFNRFVGLEIIEKKETMVREMYNTWKASSNCINYNIEDIKNGIEESEKNIKSIDIEIQSHNNKIDKINNKISGVNISINGLVISKKPIDGELINIDRKQVTIDIKEIKKKCNLIKTNLLDVQKKIDKIGNVIYDEGYHSGIIKKGSDIDYDIKNLLLDIKRNQGIVDDLKNGESCPVCKRGLEGVDNSEEITDHNNTINDLNNKITKKKKELISTNKLITECSLNKTRRDDLDRHNLLKDRYEVDIDVCGSSLDKKERILEGYDKNSDNIQTNIDIDNKLSIHYSNLNLYNSQRDTLISKLQQLKDNRSITNKSIIENKKLLGMVIKEKEVQRIFELYIKIMGRNGISRLILKSIIPPINNEISRLLGGVCDFDTEIFINDKNEVDFYIIKDGIKTDLSFCSGFEKTIGSLALRCVLGRISTLPKPSIIVLDEILGKTANSNLDNVKFFIDRMREYYDILFMITHNPLVKEWGDHVITVKKSENISSFSVI